MVVDSITYIWLKNVYKLNKFLKDMSYSKEDPRNYPDNSIIINGYQVLRDQAIDQFIYWNKNNKDLNQTYETAINQFIS